MPATAAAAAAGDDEVHPTEAVSGERWLLKKTSKSRRLEEYYKVSWPQPPEEPGEGELQTLRSAWESLVDPDLALLLFPVNKFGPPNQDGVIATISELQKQLQGPWALQHTDFILKWCCYALCLRETAGGLLKVLALIADVFTLVRNGQPSSGASTDCFLHEGEISFIMPQLVDKSGA
jgi:hypothetical protein